MRRRSWNVLLIAALLLGALPMTATPQQTTLAAAPAASGPTAPVVNTPQTGAEPQLATPERQMPPHVQELSAEELAAAESMSPEEFVGQYGYLPHALEDQAAGRSTMLIIELDQKPLAARYAEQRAAGQAMAESLGPSAHFQRCDVTSDAEGRAAIAAARAAFGRIDALVNCAPYASRWKN